MSVLTDIVTLYCPTCDADRNFYRDTRPETHAIRDRPITADVPVCVCAPCGKTQFDPQRDAMAPLYRAYRAQTGLLAPEAIKRIREQYGLSREAFAAVLGMSPASLYRYEGGALQDDLHDSMIFACDEPGTMRRLVDRRRDRLSDVQHRRFEAALQALVA